MKNVAVIGSSGLIGSELCQHLKNSFKINRIRGRSLYEDPRKIAEIIKGNHIIINLSGQSISGRWNRRNMNLIEISRFKTTSNLINAFNLLEIKPELYINASGISVYNDGIIMDETSLDFSDNFLARVVRKWENIAFKANEMGIETSIIRIGMVLSLKGGAYPKLRKIVRFFIGGPVGNGKQGMSFIHLEDLVRTIEFIIYNNINGIINLCAPVPTTNGEFIKTLVKKLNRPSFINLPVFFLKLVLLEGHSLLSKGQRAFPGKLTEKGFIFLYPDICKCIDKLEE